MEYNVPAGCQSASLRQQSVFDSWLLQPRLDPVPANTSGLASNEHQPGCFLLLRISSLRGYIAVPSLTLIRLVRLSDFTSCDLILGVYHHGLDPTLGDIPPATHWPISCHAQAANRHRYSSLLGFCSLPNRWVAFAPPNVISSPPAGPREPGHLRSAPYPGANVGILECKYLSLVNPRGPRPFGIRDPKIKTVVDLPSEHLPLTIRLLYVACGCLPRASTTGHRSNITPPMDLWPTEMAANWLSLHSTTILQPGLRMAQHATAHAEIQLASAKLIIH